jgi:hypothetical protein
MKTTSIKQWAVSLASVAALIACGCQNPTATPASAPSANRIVEFENASDRPAATDLSGVRELVGTTVVLDSWHKIRYFHGTRAFNCKGGTKANGELLVAVYDAGNTLGKPVGSGWYTVNLKPGVCGVSQNGLYGCKFDIAGRLTECGAAAFREVEQGIVITRASVGPGTNQAIIQPPRRTAAPNVPISKAVKAKVAAPVPGPNAKIANSFSSIGKGKASISGAGHAHSDYTSWSEK